MTPQPQIRIWWDTTVSAYRMALPYSQQLVDALHKVIPYSDRSFDKATKIWTFSEKHLQPLQDMLKLINMSPVVVTRQQAEAAQQQTASGASTQRGVPLNEVIIQFVRLVPPAAMTKAYRAAAATLHPDVPGGDATKMSTLNAAWERIQKEVYGGSN